MNISICVKISNLLVIDPQIEEVISLPLLTYLKTSLTLPKDFQ
jgi:hypothetical protein